MLSERPERIRAFVAVRVADEVRGAIEELIAELRAPGDGIRWVAPANLHLTLKFLGPAVPIDRLRRIEHELESVAATTAAFEVDALGVGAFPNLNRPRVLWIGLRGDALIDLAGRIEDAASRCGFTREKRALHPHLTIARLNRARLLDDTRAKVERALERSFGASTIREMTLYRSHTVPGGPIYEVLNVYEFRT